MSTFRTLSVFQYRHGRLIFKKTSLLFSDRLSDPSNPRHILPQQQSLRDAMPATNLGMPDNLLNRTGNPHPLQPTQMARNTPHSEEVEEIFAAVRTGDPLTAYDRLDRLHSQNKELDAVQRSQLLAVMGTTVNGYRRVRLHPWDVPSCAVWCDLVRDLVFAYGSTLQFHHTQLATSCLNALYAFELWSDVETIMRPIQPSSVHVNWDVQLACAVARVYASAGGVVPRPWLDTAIHVAQRERNPVKGLLMLLTSLLRGALRTALFSIDCVGDVRVDGCAAHACSLLSSSRLETYVSMLEDASCGRDGGSLPASVDAELASLLVVSHVVATTSAFHSFVPSGNAEEVKKRGVLSAATAIRRVLGIRPDQTLSAREISRGVMSAVLSKVFHPEILPIALIPHLLDCLHAAGIPVLPSMIDSVLSMLRKVICPPRRVALTASAAVLSHPLNDGQLPIESLAWIIRDVPLVVGDPRVDPAAEEASQNEFSEPGYSGDTRLAAVLQAAVFPLVEWVHPSFTLCRGHAVRCFTLLRQTLLSQPEFARHSILQACLAISCALGWTDVAVEYAENILAWQLTADPKSSDYLTVEHVAADIWDTLGQLDFNRARTLLAEFTVREIEMVQLGICSAAALSKYSTSGELFKSLADVEMPGLLKVLQLYESDTAAGLQCIKEYVDHWCHVRHPSVYGTTKFNVASAVLLGICRFRLQSPSACAVAAYYFYVATSRKSDSKSKLPLLHDFYTLLIGLATLASPRLIASLLAVTRNLPRFACPILEVFMCRMHCFSVLTSSLHADVLMLQRHNTQTGHNITAEEMYCRNIERTLRGIRHHDPIRDAVVSSLYVALMMNLFLRRKTHMHQPIRQGDWLAIQECFVQYQMSAEPGDNATLKLRTSVLELVLQCLAVIDIQQTFPHQHRGVNTQDRRLVVPNPCQPRPLSTIIQFWPSQPYEAGMFLGRILQFVHVDDASDDTLKGSLKAGMRIHVSFDSALSQIPQSASKDSDNLSREAFMALFLQVFLPLRLDVHKAFLLGNVVDDRDILAICEYHIEKKNLCALVRLLGPLWHVHRDAGAMAEACKLNVNISQLRPKLDIESIKSCVSFCIQHLPPSVKRIVAEEVLVLPGYSRILELEAAGDVQPTLMPSSVKFSRLDLTEILPEY